MTHKSQDSNGLRNDSVDYSGDVRQRDEGGGQTAHESAPELILDGGKGQRTLRPRDRGDINMVRRAIERGWNIPDQIRDTFIPDVVSIMEDETLPASTRLAAGSLIVAADKVNLERLKILVSLERPESPRIGTVNVNVNQSDLPPEDERILSAAWRVIAKPAV